MKQISIQNILVVSLVTLFYLQGCNSKSSINGESSEDDLEITEISQDINIYDDETHIIDSDSLNATGSITLGGKSVLKIVDATITFELVEDLELGIYLEDDSRIIIENSTISSNGKMWEFELRNNASIEVKDSNLLNHSAVKLFDNSKLDGLNSIIEELRMDDYGTAKMVNSEIYPNLQFFFSVPEAIIFPLPYESIDFNLNHQNAWNLEMIDSIAQGWQVDIYPGADITIKDSKDVNLGLRSNGQMNDILYLRNPHDLAINFTLTEFGFDLSVENTEIYFINLYPIFRTLKIE